jgi:hypothetical protein
VNIVVIELLVVLPLLAFAIWEYIKVSRDLKEDQGRDDDS